MGPSLLLRRGLQAIAVCAFVVVVTFLLVRIVPGDPVSAISGPQASAETREAIRAELHLESSLPSQFTAYIGDLLQGDLGHSIVQQGKSVTSIIGESLPITLYVVFGALVISAVFGVAFGLLAAVRGGGIDMGTRAAVMVFLAVPPFFLGLLLILLLALEIPVFPAGGWGEGWPQNLEYLVLPSIALSATLMPLVASVTRQAAKDAMRQPWAEAASARGLPARLVVFRHILPNCAASVITLLGFNASVLISGAVVVEAVFGLPGLGQELVTAVTERNYPVIQGIALVTALIVVAINLAADLLSLAVDPRIDPS
ncbi:MAG: ABC transporter permease [Actinobacteria bacterium]|nr:ABC transporter permease [Actinomycetota bacterium]